MNKNGVLYQGEPLIPAWAVWIRCAFCHGETSPLPSVYISVLFTPPANRASLTLWLNASLRPLLPSSRQSLPFCSSGAIFLFVVLWLSCCLPVSVSFLSVSHALHLQKVIFPRQDDVLISFLPLAHMFERIIQVRNLPELTRPRGAPCVFFQSQWSPTCEDVHISYLPLAHMFERMVQVRS